MKTNLWIEKLETIYKDKAVAEATAKKIETLVSSFDCKTNAKPLNQEDSILITYGDTVVNEGEKPLVTLKSFLQKFIGNTISTVHILPFFPYTSDDGFSITDYYNVNPELGTWNEISAIAEDYNLMIDSVANHVSQKNPWFQEYLKGNPEYKDFFIECDKDDDYSSVTRPRTSPLLTPFMTKDGEKYIWTTFSDDQIDLNYRNPEVLLKIIEALLTYVQHGARFIRLDAIGFIWKEKGTSCMHLKETHEIIKLMKLVLEEAAPGVMIITETNVPQPDNVSYFGNCGDEATLVYQFPLPPLVMHTLITGNASVLTKWASELYQPEGNYCYFNFLSSHDGIGLRPTDGILSEKQKNNLVETTLRNGGRVSYKNNPDGTQSPYELNISYIDALSGQYESDSTRCNKMVAAMAILLSLQGVPGIYIHSLLGTRNYYLGMTTSGIARRINREKLSAEKLFSELEDKDSQRAIVFKGIKHLLDVRKTEAAFSPFSKQQILSLDDKLFAVRRGNGNGSITAVINVSGEYISIDTGTSGTDILTGEHLESKTTLSPYQVRWIRH